MAQYYRGISGSQIVFWNSEQTAPIGVTNVVTVANAVFGNDEKVWTDENDGIGSGLDADLIDGSSSSGGTIGLLPVSSSTQALWNFNDNLNDSGPHGYNLTQISGAPAYCGDIAKPLAALFPGGSHGKSTTGSFLRISTSMTIEMVASNLIPTGVQYIIISSTFGARRRYMMGIDSSPSGWRLYFGFDDTGGTPRYTSGATPSMLYQRGYYVFTRDVSGGNTTLKTYMNGQLINTTVHTGIVPHSGGDIGTYIGSETGNATPLVNYACISQLHITDNVMTLEEIQARAAIVGCFN